MSALLTNVISIRSEDYTVSEIDGKTMKQVRKLLAGDEMGKQDIEPLVALTCCVSPKIKNMEELLTMPSFVIMRISTEAFRLSGIGGADEKNA